MHNARGTRASVNNKRCTNKAENCGSGNSSSSRDNDNDNDNKKNAETTAIGANIDSEIVSTLTLPETVARGCHVCDHWVYGP